VRPVLVDGTVGALLAPQGHLSRVLRLTIKEGKIREVEIIGDPARLQELHVAVLES
jgi:RNA polymerase sigma-70 factor (ECF subfamily)